MSYNKLTIRSHRLISVRWLGFILMNIGELGNFISYAFAPASVVAPLGTVSKQTSSLLQPDGEPPP